MYYCDSMSILICAFCKQPIKDRDSEDLPRVVNVPRGEIRYFCTKVHRKLWRRGATYHPYSRPTLEERDNGWETVSFQLEGGKKEKLEAFQQKNEIEFFSQVMRQVVDEFLKRHGK